MGTPLHAISVVVVCSPRNMFSAMTSSARAPVGLLLLGLPRRGHSVGWAGWVVLPSLGDVGDLGDFGDSGEKILV